MSSQRLVIAKIGGDAAEVTLSRFRRWQAARSPAPEPEYEFSPEQWPQNVRIEADGWAETLRLHGHEPPVVFFAEYIDYWSTSPPARYLPDELIQVHADTNELYCGALPWRNSVLRKLQETTRRGQWPEDRWFAAATLAAISSWSTLVDRAVLVVVRQVVAGLATDEELIESLSRVPDWMTHAPA